MLKRERISEFSTETVQRDTSEGLHPVPYSTIRLALKRIGHKNTNQINTYPMNKYLLMKTEGITLFQDINIDRDIANTGMLRKDKCLESHSVVLWGSLYSNFTQVFSVLMYAHA